MSSSQKAKREAILQQLKPLEGQRVQFLHRGSYRPFILQAVQTEEGLIKGKWSGDIGDVRLDYDYPGKREWPGFWTRRVERILLEF